jgi:hypothetical protein
MRFPPSGARNPEASPKASQGSTFLDRMIALAEGAAWQKAPNEIALVKEKYRLPQP